MKKQILAVVCILLAPFLGRADESVLSTAGLGMSLDTTTGSARAKAMGSAFVGIADDSSSLFVNPAGLGGLSNPEIAFHHNSWLVDTLQETVVYTMPLSGWGGVGFSVNYADYGTFEGRDGTGTLVSGYTAKAWGVSAGWGMEVAKGVSVGITLGDDQQTLADQGYSSFSAGIGGLWDANPWLRLGAAYTGLGTNVGSSSKASALRVGLSTPVRSIKDNDLLFAVGTEIQPQGANFIEMGAEDEVYSLFSMRVGYQMGLTDNKLQGLSGMTAGLGFVMQGFALDYAYLPFGDLGTSNRISLTYQFATPAPKTQEPQKTVPSVNVP